MQHNLKTPQESVLYLKLMPANQLYADTKMLAALLNAVNLSFESFIMAELTSRNSTIKPALKKEHNVFLGECRLILKDIDFKNLTICLKVNAAEENISYKNIKNVPELKQKLFGLFTDTVFNPDLFTADVVKFLSGRYSAKERINVFKPIT
ncbi:MAG: hypothetical protein EOP42_21350, partial [Sphingobacteriaceae bacterium]